METRAIESKQATPRALDGQVRALLIEIARALHRYSIYPADHPTLRGSTNALAELLREGLGERTELTIQVGRGQLAVDGIVAPLDGSSLLSLADHLRDNGVAALSIERDIRANELEELLSALCRNVRDGRGRTLLDRSWRHVRIAFLHYDKLVLGEEAADPMRSDHVHNVWLELARTALGDAGSPAEVATDSVRLASDIRAHCTDEAYARRVTQRLIEVEQAIESAPGESVELRDLTSDLVASLDSHVLRNLLHCGASAKERQLLLTQASGTLRAGAVVKLLREIAELDDCEIPHAVWLMLNKLARYADSGAQQRRSSASRVVREQVLQLLADWNASGITPEDYGHVLEAMSVEGSGTRRRGSGRSRASVEPDRTVQMGVEVGRLTEGVVAALEEMIGEGEISALLEVLEEAPPDNPTAIEVGRRLEDPVVLDSLLAAETPSFEVIDRILARLGLRAADPMLTALSESESRSTRSQLFRRLAKLGPEIAPRVAARLDDRRWYVRRNMLALLDELGGMPAGLSAEPYLDDEEGAVRLMAIKLLLRESRGRTRAISAALDCNDTRTVILGLNAAREGCPEELVDRIAELLLDAGTPLEIGIHAVRSLEGSQSEKALHTLLRLARPRRGLARLRRSGSQPALATEARSVLLSAWTQDERALALLSKNAVAGKAPRRAPR